MKQQWGIVKIIKDYWAIIIFTIYLIVNGYSTFTTAMETKRDVKEIRSDIVELKVSVGEMKGALKGTNDLTLKP